jgi:hypothetical protein
MAKIDELLLPQRPLGRRLGDLTATTEQVQVPDTQPHPLAGAKPGKGGKAHRQHMAPVESGRTRPQ